MLEFEKYFTDIADGKIIACEKIETGCRYASDQILQS